MTSGSFIPAELSWLEDGHVTDVALNALADGEDAIVLPAVRSHVEDCDACSARLAQVALASFEMGELLGAPPPLEAPARTRTRALPVRAVVAAFALALVGAVPLFIDTWTGLPATTATVTRMIPILARSAMVVLRHGSIGLGRAASVVSWACTVVAVAAGLLIARAATRKARNASVQGGV